MDGAYRIRTAVAADAAAMVVIERRCFGDPWSENSFREAMTASWSFGLVPQTARGIAGYVVCREAGGTGEILNIAVAPEFRRRGIARALLRAAIEALRRRSADEIFLEVRESNLRAQALYLAAGFRAVGQRAAYYRNPREDALLLRLELERRA